ncbi:MAG TPA: 4'-phosphopantetheinyl transferase superfamily protein [Nitrospira sp.]|nr:4'-phosphopantetheinyl transferase superfamily protein [Nitrospira sp.]
MEDCALTLSFHSCNEIGTHTTQPLSIQAGDIHLWGIRLEADRSCADQFRCWIDAEERGRADRFIHNLDRQRYVLAHGTLRGILSRYVGAAPGVLPIAREKTGKPYLPHEPIVFSMAHSQGRLVVAVAKSGRIGIDLEEIRDTVPVLKLAERFYRPSEAARISALSADDRTFEFYRYWVAKEAALKAEGSGLSSLHACEIFRAASPERAMVALFGSPQQSAGWTVQWLRCGAGWTGAVAYQGDAALRIMTQG